MKNGLILGFIAAMVPSLALAQGAAPTPAPTEVTEPSLPSNPTSPTDFQGPAQTSTGTTAVTSGGSTGAAPTGYSGGDLLITDINPALYGANSAKRKVPDYHTVIKGDTLWTMCQFYYGDPWAWPQLWAYNTEITNPHWIYPGDRVRMLGLVKSSSSEPGEEKVKMLAHPRLISKVMRLRQRGFVVDGELARSASVLGSLQERKMLTRHDEIYIKGAERFKPTLGKLFTIYRVDRVLKDREGKKVGHLVKILGTARIKRLTRDKAATALVIEAYNEILRGDRVGPLRRTYKAVPLRAAEKDLEGRVIDNLPDIKALGEFQMVFIDRGKNHGVRLGNRFLVVRQGDGAESMIPEEYDDEAAQEYPEETVAEISILDVSKKSSMGMVTRSIREIRTGDRVRMRRGY